MASLSRAALRAFVLVFSVVSVSEAFYIPGVQPTYYAEGEEVHFWVNSLRSLQVLFPKEYYTLPFCRPSEVITKDESIGEIIWGDRIQNSLYVANMKKNVNCSVVPNCDAIANTKEVMKNVDELENLIEKGYRGFMNIDNLPVFGELPPDLLAHCASIPKDMRHTFYRGYWLGTPSACTGKTLINNHLEFVIKYNHAPHDPSRFMVVGLKATPYSIKHSDDGLSCSGDLSVTGGALDFLTTDDVRGGTVVHWSYGVTWEKSDVLWATRWDEYLHSSVADSSPAFHWLYVCSSLVVVLMCAASVATILMRTLHRDFHRYNSPSLEDDEEESGWKLVHADVFRPPDRAPLLAALTGNGYQVLGMSAGTIFFSLLGFLSPARRGALLTAIIFLFVFMSVVSGYVCGFLLKYFGRCEWKHIFFCGCAFPGAIVGVYTFANIINYSHGSSGTVPFSLLFTLLALWILISVPLTILGASFSFRQETLSNPVAVGRLAREIPPQPFMSGTLFLLLVPPVFPLCTIILELNFMLQALWSGQVYYVFGFLALVSFIWVIITALVTVFHLYYTLCRENHQWWWPAFFIPGGFGVPLFIYSTFFYMTQLAIQSFASSLLYFLYMGLVSYAYGLAAGAVGLTSGIMFVRKIYGSIKVD